MILKNPRTLLRSLTTGPGPVAESFESFQRFIAKLERGSTASVVVEMSPDGYSWTEVCTFSLDVVGQEVNTGLLEISMSYLRATTTTLSGRTPSVIVYFGG